MHNIASPLWANILCVSVLCLRAIVCLIAGFCFVYFILELWAYCSFVVGTDNKSTHRCLVVVLVIPYCIMHKDINSNCSVNIFFFLPLYFASFERSYCVPRLLDSPLCHSASVCMIWFLFGTIVHSNILFHFGLSHCIHILSWQMAYSIRMANRTSLALELFVSSLCYWDTFQIYKPPSINKYYRNWEKIRTRHSKQSEMDEI